VTAPTTARKEAARMAREAYDTRVARKTRADQVAAMRVKAATDAKANPGRDMCVLRLGNSGEVISTLAAMREALVCVEAHMAAFITPQTNRKLALRFRYLALETFNASIITSIAT
jgi:hypothetical protein